MKIRPTLLRLHRWVALGTSAFLLVIALSGIVTVFTPAYERMRAPALLLVQPESTRQPLDSLVQVAAANGAPSLVIVPRDADESVQIFGLNANRKPFITYVNPYTAQILGMKTIAELQAGIMLRIRLLHRTLLQGKNGGRVVGFVTLLAIFMAVSGLILWWPRKIVRVGRRGSGARFTFDLHNAVGVLSSSMLLLLALTGAAIAYPSIGGWLQQRFDAPFEEEPDYPPPAAASTPLSLDSLVAVLRAAVPGGQPAAITLPRADNAVISMGVRLPGEATNATRSRMWMDRFTGRVLRVDVPQPVQSDQRRTSVRLVVAMLHTGVLYGWITGLVVVLGASGQIVLVITGLVMWGKRTWRGLRRTPSAD